MDTILEEDHPRNIPPKFCQNWLSGFRGEDFFVIVDGRTTDGQTDDGCKVMRKAHMVFRPGELKSLVLIE